MLSSNSYPSTLRSSRAYVNQYKNQGYPESTELIPLGSSLNPLITNSECNYFINWASSS